MKIKEITIITGVRRSGKSTFMYQMIALLLRQNIEPEQILFVNFDDKKFTNDSLDEIYLTYKQNVNPDKKAYIFFDEIHKKNDWESWIRKKYDLKSAEKFVVSGSCSYLLKKEYATLLTGRNLTFEVFPLSFAEYLEFNGINLNEENIKKGIIGEKTIIAILRNFEEFLNFGGFPEIQFKEKNFKTKVLEQYFDDIIYKDIVDRYNLNSQKVRDFALYLMTNFTGVISLRSLRSSLQISYDTIKDYLAYFKEAFLFFAVEHFSYSFKEQKTLPTKIYSIDNGLRNSVSFVFSKDEGKLAENLVCIELFRRNNMPYYWKNKREVDFVVKNKNNTLTAINVSYTDKPNEREIESLVEFKENFKRTKEMILLTKNSEKKEKNIQYLPLWKWLLLNS